MSVLIIEWGPRELSLAEFAAYCTFLKQRHDQLAHARILLICGAARNDKSCPGETSKTYRMAKLAQTIFENHRAEVDVLDLSLLTSEYDRVIYPCKGCVSTAMPLALLVVGLA